MFLHSTVQNIVFQYYLVVILQLFLSRIEKEQAVLEQLTLSDIKDLEKL